MIPKIDIKVRGLKEAKQELEQLKGRIKNWSPIEDVMHALLIERMATNFDTAGRSEGNAWASYGAEPKYAAYKMAITGHNDLLRWDKGGRYERLYPSLTDRRDGHHVWRQDGPMSFTYGTSLPYARGIERDNRGPFGEISPGREFSYVGPTTTSRVSTTILNWIFRGKRSGL